MPYIQESNREKLDKAIDELVKQINSRLLFPDDPKYLWDISGEINYCVSRILGQLMKQTSYSKIAIITGVLENIKQEFYRRIASPYEDQKIIQNGDIREYKS